MVTFHFSSSFSAQRARQRILERLAVWEVEDPPIDYRFSMTDMWSRKVFLALLRRYGIQPYRYRGQRYTTVVARVQIPSLLNPLIGAMADRAGASWHAPWGRWLP